MRAMWIFLIFTLWSLLGFQSALATTAGSNSTKAPKGRYASIIIDMETDEIIHARQIDQLRYPASLTKVMTLYLTFEALEAGNLKIDQVVSVSSNAAAQPASKLGLRTGQRVIIKDMINAVILKSANDAAMVLAETLGGSELKFADMMSDKAWALKMRKTTFKNPHGLSQSGHVTTARDMAKLATALIRDHKSYYGLFSQDIAKFKGRLMRNSNKLLERVEGVDGLKTGYTRASGYNLMTSAERNGHRIVAVVMGGASSQSRDEHMETLIERGFEVIQKRGTNISLSPTPKRIVKIAPIPSHSNTLQTSSKGYPTQISNIKTGANSASVRLINPATLNMRGSQKTAKQDIVQSATQMTETLQSATALDPNLPSPLQVQPRSGRARFQ